MTYDLTPTPQLLEILKLRELTKAERAVAREQIGRYYAKKLAHLQQHLFEALVMRRTEELDPFEIDEYIHRYHKQSQELYVYINTQSHSNASLPIWLEAIEADEQGRNVWQPRTMFPHEEQHS
ncbi:hypothetical protein KSF_065320 [Reticulibacter mediterranei]|uniref:Uncharacterized protein n=1 Tax=Reticulibacter mediterranei TaxID=2778369 RepID=A0A8J3IR79_9CHLR|nr:hypothetical protein [Reticulibacter mediterranei]GHO96484.1 hypothetical protein KSF_065320 [Reticulibacter mediterranei]